MPMAADSTRRTLNPFGSPRSRVDTAVPASTTIADRPPTLYRAAGRPEVSAYDPHGLVDVPPGLTRAVRWAKGVGIVTIADGDKKSQDLEAKEVR